jgi:hypothetical protein
MKKFTALFCFMLVSILVYSQKQTKFGVFLDPQVSWLVPESRTVYSDGAYWGLNGGLSIDRYFQKNYAFSTGISLGRQGGKLIDENEKVIPVYDETDTLPAGTSLSYKLQYFTVPLGLKLKTNQIGYTTLFVNLGFTGQLNLKSRGESNNNGGLKDDSIKEEMTWFNAGYHFGGGFEYALGEDNSLSFGIFYHNGFIDITKSAPEVVSRVVSLRLGIIF